MISISLATQLREAGLAWQPEINDFFMVPERGLDDRIFVLDNMPAVIEKLFGTPVVAFQGSSEWALDYLIAAEAIWLPRDEQLREHLLAYLSDLDAPRLALIWLPEGYTCEMAFAGQRFVFEAGDAADAYAMALLHLLQNTPVPPSEAER